jgi:hypothetical protein
MHIAEEKNSTHHSCFIPERLADTSQKFLRDAYILPKLFSYELQIDHLPWEVSAITPIVAFYYTR